MPLIKPLPADQSESPPQWFAGLAGVFAAIVLLKLGNPIILDHLIEPPHRLDEIIFWSWPVNWGYGLLAILALASLAVVRLKTDAPRWIVWLPLAWLGWQFLSATQTVDAALTRETLKHFTGCVVCFYIGLLALGPCKRTTGFWIGLLAGFVGVLMVGFNQHYGGLEETRRFIYDQIQKGEVSPHPHLIAKMSSERIFGTLVYPNALAGVILLLLPASLAATWRLTERGSNVVRGVLTGVLAYAGLACLYWSGSKSGWLIALGQGLLLLCLLPFNRIAKLAVVLTVIGVGLGVFFVRFDTYFQKGAKSVGARFDYWQAALKTAGEHPVMGSGPGTFYVAYRKVKRPESEMARLAHNDFLQQASDSGVLGCCAYAWMVLGSVAALYRKRLLENRGSSPMMWLGLIGWVLQGFVEFGLYIPASAWLAFLLLGWLWSDAATKRMHTTPT